MTTSTNEAVNFRLAPLRRESGGFAMLAVDQREALRNMLREHRAGPVSDADLQEFKLTATRALTPFASAVLIDRQFALDAAIEQGAVADSCGLIASADHFEPAHGELVGEVTIDHQIAPGSLRERGVVALKLLVLYRPDQPPSARIEMVHEFLAICGAAGVASIVEPVSRAPLDGRDWDWNEGVLAAAEELGSLGADLYKGEVPYRGVASEEELRSAYAEMNRSIDGEWVVLSSGVDQETFPPAVRIACEEGASGFLAGRAVWAASLQAADIEHDLQENATWRLERLVDVVDATVGSR